MRDAVVASAHSLAVSGMLQAADFAACFVAGAMEKIGVAYWRAKAADLADKAQDNHGISAQKFHLLREFLSLGYRVLLSGVWCGRRRAARVSSRPRAMQTSTSSHCRIHSIFWCATLM